MRHRINPWIDCVFKALFADEDNSDLLIDLLNGVLAPDIVIREVELLNPYNEAEFVGDDVTIVDVKARDDQGRIYQLELQLQVRPTLPQRMVYTWADIYQNQLQRGDDYNLLRPVISIWLLGERLFRDNEVWHHTFLLTDPVQERCLTDQLRIDVIELPNWRRGLSRLVGADRWMLFLNEARNWDKLPEELADPLMRKAMSVLSRFSEKEREYWRYQDRMNNIRERETLRKEQEQELAAARADLAAERAERLALELSAQAERAAMHAEFMAIRAELSSMRAALAERDRPAGKLSAPGESPE